MDGVRARGRAAAPLARAQPARVRAGGTRLTAAAIACAVLACAVVAGAALLAGCSSGRPAGRAHRPRGHPSATAVSASERKKLAAAYLAIADAGNHRLEIDFDGLHRRDWRHLTAARADLRDAAATERLFDRRLLGIAFPPAIEQTARFLFWLNQSRARLTAAAVGSTSLRRLHWFARRLNAANRPVEQAVAMIRRELGLPPPQAS